MAKRSFVEGVLGRLRDKLESAVAVAIAVVVGGLLLAVWTFLDGLPGSLVAMTALAGAATVLVSIFYIKRLVPVRALSVGEKRDLAIDRLETLRTRLTQFAIDLKEYADREISHRQEAFVELHGQAAALIAEALAAGRLRDAVRHFMDQVKEVPYERHHLRRRLQRSHDYLIRLCDQLTYLDVNPSWDGR